jgi:hypothetical protein
MRRLMAAGLLTMTACASPGGSSTTMTVEPAVEVSEAPVGGGAMLIGGVETVEVLAPPATGAGPVPVFRWSRVEGAARYDLVVVGPQGPIWAWQGEETEVALGGLASERPEGLGGPILETGSCWSVVALDNHGHVIAASPLLSISPDQTAGPSCRPGEMGAPMPGAGDG